MEIYEQVAEALNGRPLVIRTFDFGDEKVPLFLAAEHRNAVTWGLRGLQFSLAEHKLLDTQLRAIAHAAQGRDVRVLFPMVVGGDDLRRACEALTVAVERVGGKQRPQVGAMVETPAALFALEEILELADFVAIGTNDLTPLYARRPPGCPRPGQRIHGPSSVRAEGHQAHCGRGPGAASPGLRLRRGCCGPGFRLPVGRPGRA